MAGYIYILLRIRSYALLSIKLNLEGKNQFNTKNVKSIHRIATGLIVPLQEKIWENIHMIFVT